MALRSRSNPTYVAGAVTATLLLVFLVLGDRIRQEQTVVFRGTATSVRLTLEAPVTLGEGSDRSRNVDLWLRASSIATCGTRLQFFPANEGAAPQTIEPKDVDHIAYFNFGEPVVIHTRLPHNSELTFLSGAALVVHPYVRERLQDFPEAYEIAVVFETPSQDPLWIIPTGHDRKDPAAMTKADVGGRMFGYTSTRDLHIEDGSYTSAQINGYYFARKDWPLDPPPFFMPLRGYRVSIAPPKQTIRIDVIPKLLLSGYMGTERGDLHVSASSLTVGEASGDLYMSGDKKIETGGGVPIDIPSGNIQISLRPTRDTLTLEIKAKTASTIVDGHEEVPSYLSRMIGANPTVANIALALVAAFLGALVATKGKVFHDWVKRGSKDCRGKVG